MYEGRTEQRSGPGPPAPKIMANIGRLVGAGHCAKGFGVSTQSVLTVAQGHGCSRCPGCAEQRGDLLLNHVQAKAKTSGRTTSDVPGLPLWGFPAPSYHSRSNVPSTGTTFGPLRAPAPLFAAREFSWAQCVPALLSLRAGKHSSGAWAQGPSGKHLRMPGGGPEASLPDPKDRRKGLPPGMLKEALTAGAWHRSPAPPSVSLHKSRPCSCSPSPKDQGHEGAP